MPYLFDAFTSGQKGVDEARFSDLAVQTGMLDLARKKWLNQDEQAYYSKLAAAANMKNGGMPTANTLPMSGGALGEVPNAAAESQGQLTMPGGAPPPPPQGGMPTGMPDGSPPQGAPTMAAPNPVQLLQMQIDSLRKQSEAIGAPTGPTSQAQQQALFKNITEVTKDLNLAKKNQDDEDFRQKQLMADQIGAVKDQQSLDYFMATVPAQYKSGLMQGLSKIGLAPQMGYEGPPKYDFKDPRMQSFVSNMQTAAMTAVQRDEATRRAAQTADDVAKRIQEDQRIKETAQHNRSDEGLSRERNLLERQRIEQPLIDVGSGTAITRPLRTASGWTQPQATPIAGLVSKDAMVRGAELRKEMTSALKPVEDVQQNVTQIKQLLATSSPASDIQINKALGDWVDPSRNLGAVFKENKNFGSLAGRMEGFLSEAFTGRYTETQRNQIRSMVNDMETNVLSPQRDKISSYHQDLAKRSNVPVELVAKPNFYQDKAPIQIKSDADYAAVPPNTEYIAPDGSRRRKG